MVWRLHQEGAADTGKSRRTPSGSGPDLGHVPIVSRPHYLGQPHQGSLSICFPVILALKSFLFMYFCFINCAKGFHYDIYNVHVMYFDQIHPIYLHFPLFSSLLFSFSFSRYWGLNSELHAG
jgi:hypothetical protein